MSSFNFIGFICIMLIFQHTLAQPAFQNLSVQMLHEKAENISNMHPDSTLFYLNLASEKITFAKKKKISYEFDMAVNDLLRAQYWIFRNSDKGEVYLLRARNYFMKSDDYEKIAHLYYVYAAKDFFCENRLKYISYLDTSLNYALKSKDTVSIGLVYYAFGHYLQREGRWNESLMNAKICVQLADSTRDSLLISAAHFLMGRLNSYYTNYDAAVAHLRKSVEFGANRWQLASIYQVLGQVLLENQQIGEALLALRKALKLYKHDKREVGMHTVISTYIHIGNALLQKGNFEEAHNNLMDARMELLQQDCHICDQILAFHEAKVYSHSNQSYLALNVLGTLPLSVDHPESFGEKNFDALKEIGIILANSGQLDKALMYFDLWGRKKDSLYSTLSREQLGNIEKLYLTEKSKHDEVLAVNHQLTSSKKSQVIMGGSLILVILLTGILIFFLRFRALKERERYRIRFKDTQLKQVLIAQEDERKRLARELHDSIGQSLVALKMQLQMSADNKISNSTIERVDALCREVRSLSHQMMPLVLLENGLKKALEMLAENSLRRIGIEIDLVVHGLEQRMDNFSEIHLYRVVQELMGNILKHSGATKVGIQLLHRNNKLITIVEDNGKGFDPNAVHRGIGLTNIRSRVESLSGKIEISSSEGEGTYVRISVPLAVSGKKTA